MNENFDPKKIIDFSKDYYSILGIEKDILPSKMDRDNKVKSSKIIEEAFRKQARKCHPDFGGSKEAFLDLVRARRILEDSFLKRIYDQGYFDEFKIEALNQEFEVDWTKIGTYRKGTIEDTVGMALFLKICDKKTDLNIIPAFFPETEEHNYEWDWVISNTNFKLVLSIVNDENEVLRLSDSETIEDSLPFKIYICVPKSSLNLLRKNENILDPNGKVLMNAEINKVQYSDYDLLETTNIDAAYDYLDKMLSDDLNKIRLGTFKSKDKKTETKWLDTDTLNRIDKSQLQNIINFKHYKFEDNKTAGDFLDYMNDEE